MRAFDFAADQPWAIDAPHLQLILDIAQRAHEPDFAAVAQKQAERSDSAGVLEIRGGVATINVIGPIFRYANIFASISGATSVEELATAFRAAVDDPSVLAIVLNVDSPGGEVAGISELATAIYDAREKKPIVAYVDDVAQSGGYWIASAASKVIVADTARLGSLGVAATVKKRDETPGIRTYEIVSSVSPNKRLDVETDAGRAAIQTMVDDLASVFISAVARNRGVPEATVLAQFGQGLTLVASKAIAAGMADGLGSFEGLVSDMQSRRSPGAIQFSGGEPANSIGGSLTMETTKPSTSETPAVLPAVAAAPPPDLGAIRAEGGKAQADRIRAIINLPEAKDRDKTALAIALDTDLSVEAARKVLASIEKQAGNPLAAAMASVSNPQVGTGGGELSEDAALVAGVLAFTKGGKK